MTLRPTILLSLLAAVAAGLFPAGAATSRSWSRDGAALRAGTFDGMRLAPDGRLVPGDAEREIARPASAVVWDLLLTERAVFIAAGDGAGLLRFDLRSGATAAVAPLGEAPEVLALAGDDRAIYAATGPRGAIFKIKPDGSGAEPIATPDAEYVWALALLPDGDLLAATGLPGRVLRIDPRRRDAVTAIWETSEPHVRALAVGPAGEIWAGTADSGWVVRLDGEGGGFVVHDGARPEVAALAVAPDGALWAALAGTAGASSARADGSASTTERAHRPGETSITVRPSDGTQEKGEEKEKKKPAGRLPSGGGSLVRIGAGEEPVELWSASRETPLDLLPNGDGSVLLATAGEGRVWWVDRQGRAGWWLARRDAKAVSALARRGDRTAAATSNPAIVALYGPGPAKPARWTSDVADLAVRATLGRIAATVPARGAASVRLLARTGNTEEPGPGWSPWREVPGAAGPPGANGGVAELPPARFFQVRIEIDAGREGAPPVSAVTARYRPVNRPPRVTRVSVLPPGVAYRPVPPTSVTSGERPVVRLTPTPEQQRALSRKSDTWRSKRQFEPGALTLRWEATDPDGDELTYRVEGCRDEGTPCRRWFLLAGDLDRTFFSFDARGLEDGVYRFRVTAGDAASNYAGAGRTASAISEPVRIDTAPPSIERVDAARRDGALEIEVRARDPHGRLARAEASVEPGRWVPLPSVDGVEDGEQETFRGRLPAPDGAPVAVRVVDAAGNVAARQLLPDGDVKE